jgi:hypothetical protein
MSDWLPVLGYEDLYEVSSDGQVRSKDRVSSDGSLRRGRLLTPTGLKHKHVTLSRSGVKVQAHVHVLVLEAFVGPRPDGMECLHWDDDPTNNNVANLRWDTRAENIRDAIRNGRLSDRGSIPSGAVFSIRKRVASGERQADIAREYDVDPSAISHIVRRNSYANL